MMKRPAILVLLAVAVPASAMAESTDVPAAPAAQSAAPAAKKQVRPVRTGWSLEKVAEKKKKKERAQQSAEAAKAGPAVPAPEVVKLPKKRAAPKTAQRERKVRANAAPLVKSVLRKKN